jgi:hypothetical protein
MNAQTAATIRDYRAVMRRHALNWREQVTTERKRRALHFARFWRDASNRLMV